MIITLLYTNRFIVHHQNSLLMRFRQVSFSCATFASFLLDVLCLFNKYGP